MATSYKTIIKKLADTKLTGAQYRVLLPILAKMADNSEQTVNFTKREFAKTIGVKEQNFSRDIKYLLDNTILNCDDTSTNNRTYSLGEYFKEK